jgi:ketosteroid isomerase-like protein
MQTQVRSTREVIDHHLAALARGDVDEVVSDYTDESVLITANGVIKGCDAIRSGYTRILSTTFKPATYEFHIDSQRVDGEVCHLVWHTFGESADITLGTDTFLVRDGKILVQTYAAKVEAK